MYRNGEYLVQLSIEILKVPQGLSLPAISITESIFANALNGAIEGYNIKAKVYLENVLLIDNRRPKEVKKGIFELINTYDWIQVISCQFKNNYGSMITGSVFNIQNIYLSDLMFDNFTSVSYTHLTLPTIYSV